MSKRAKSSGAGTLTGGTGDVNPQLFHAVRVEDLSGTLAGATQNVEFSLPLNPGQTVYSDNTVDVIEVLKVFQGTVIGITLDATEAQGITFKWSLFTGASVGANTTTLNRGWSVGRVIAHANISAVARAGTAGTEGVSPGTNSTVTDLTDGAGHGFIIAANNMTTAFRVTASGSGVGSGNVNLIEHSIALLYRLKRVSLVEYLGLIQSQQGANVV